MYVQAFELKITANLTSRFYELPSHQTRGFMKNFFVLSVMIFLTSCAGMGQEREQKARQQMVQQANARFNIRIRECSQGKTTRKIAVEEETCLNNAIEALAQEIHTPYMGLFTKMTSARYSAALDYAKGKISQEEMSFRLKASRVEFDKDLAVAVAQAQENARQRQQAADEHAQQCQASLAQGLVIPTYGNGLAAINNGLIAMAQMGCQ